MNANLFHNENANVQMQHGFRHKWKEHLGQTDIKTWKAFSLHFEFYVEVLGEVVSVLFDGR